jgi:adenylate cyclase
MSIQNRDQSTRRLTFLYIASLCTVASLAVVGQFFVQSMLKQETINAKVIGAATRQQILSWQLREAALALKVEANFVDQKQHVDDIEQIIKNWDEADRELGQTMAQLETLGVDRAEMQTQMSQLKPTRQKILQAARAVVASETGTAPDPRPKIGRGRSSQTLTPKNTLANLRQIRDSGKTFSEGINQLILDYNKQAQAGLQQLRTVEYSLLGLTLLILLLEGILVFRPAVARIRRVVNDLAIALKTTQETAAKLAEEQRRSELLLLNILPAPIADRLKQSQANLEQPSAPIADGFSEVTVLFADIVGFTDLSSRVSPETMVGLLNQIFSRFDQLAEQHGLEKIKTIGDAYMVVGGLPVPRADHAAAIARMALDMQQAINQFNQTAQQAFEIRIGINTGPVVAGVIGIKKFIYDLWGDTVNIASRMESHGIPGGIQVTAATYACLKTEYHFEPRGAVAIKGRGHMETYWLKGKRS